MTGEQTDSQSAESTFFLLSLSLPLPLFLCRPQGSVLGSTRLTESKIYGNVGVNVIKFASLHVYTTVY